MRLLSTQDHNSTITNAKLEYELTLEAHLEHAKEKLEHSDEVVVVVDNRRRSKNYSLVYSVSKHLSKTINITCSANFLWELRYVEANELLKLRRDSEKKNLESYESLLADLGFVRVSSSSNTLLKVTEELVSTWKRA